MFRTTLAFAARSIVSGLLAGSPVAALAQTPRDVAHLLWPQGAPVAASTAPATPDGLAGNFTGLDLARLVAPLVKVPATAALPPNYAIDTTAGGPADLVRLSNVTSSSIQDAFTTQSHQLVAAGN